MTFRIVGDRLPNAPLEPRNIERIGPWDVWTTISGALIREAAPAIVVYEPPLVTFHTRDDSATYGLGTYDPKMDTYPARLLSIDRHPSDGLARPSQ